MSDQDLLDALPAAIALNFTPTSGYPVGAVALGTSGTLYLGANFEVPGLALNQTVHAEQAALANAYMHGETGIAAIATSATPCGHCRQFINEITNASSIRIITRGGKTLPLADLLPASFGPAQLGATQSMFSSAENTIAASGTGDALLQLAREAASRSYAPHTTSPSGCAIQLKNGATISGSYLENAAYNPSLSPLLCALVQIEMRRAKFEDIARVALVELKNAKISQRASTELVLQALGVTAKLEA